MKKIIFKLVCLSVVVTAVLLPSSRAFAQLGFGGRLVSFIPCTSSGTFLMYYVPTVPTTLVTASLVYSPFSTLPFSYYSATPGVWHLGNYMPGVQACWMAIGVPPWCVPIPNGGLMLSIGTGLAPSPY